MCALQIPGPPAEVYYLALAGGVGLAIGLVMLFSLLMRQERELARLRVEAPAREGDHRA